MLSDFTEKKKAFFTLKTEFFPSPKKRVFPKGLTYDLVKKCQFFLSLDLVKIRLEIMLNDFAEKKETFFGYKKQNFSKSKKSAFPMGLAQAFGQKMPFSSLLTFGQNKTKKKLNYFKEKKRNPF